ncbi:MAG: restriction endonuclease [Arcobacter sp.]|nr:MAG: restriction endonuclease [Arcobacter sp.]
MDKYKKVGELVTFSIKGVTPKYVEKSKIIVLNQKCIRNNRIDFSLARYVDEKQKISENKIVQKGDLLINSTGQGTAGRCAFVENIPEDAILTIDSHILLLRCSSYEETKCLNYVLFSYEKQLQTFMDGSTGQGELDKIKLFNLQVLIPSNRKEQKSIIDCISDINRKIELNNKINKELESMAKTFYEYWFVQFDFPDENGKPYKSSGGKMIYSKELKREIPEGWEAKAISQFIGNNKGGDWGKEKEEGNYTQKVSCIRGADLNGLNGSGGLNPPERFILEKNSNKILESHDLIVEISGGSPTQSTGRISFVIDETITRFDNPLICSNFCKSFSLENQKHLYYFIYMWNNLYDNSVLFGWEGKTSGIKNLLFDSFTQKYFIVIPSENINQKFYEKIDSLHKMKQKNLKQNQELSRLRDWLLPMLMNGQISVKDSDYKDNQNDLLVAQPKPEYN